jgi:hypothetical protein
MPSKKYVLRLSSEERSLLAKAVAEPRASRLKVLRARALLKCDQCPEGPAWSDARIAEALECTVNSLENWRKQAVLQGPMSLLEKQPYHRKTPPKLDGEGEARLTALAERLVSLEVVDSISHETVRQVLKKTIYSPGGNRCGVFRPNRTQRLSPRWSKC